MYKHNFYISLCQLCIALLGKFKIMTEGIKLSFMPLCTGDKKQSQNFWCLLFWCAYLRKSLTQTFLQYMCLKIQLNTTAVMENQAVLSGRALC